MTLIEETQCLLAKRPDRATLKKVVRARLLSHSCQVCVSLYEKNEPTDSANHYPDSKLKALVVLWNWEFQEEGVIDSSVEGFAGSLDGSHLGFLAVVGSSRLSWRSGAAPFPV
ncbi:MAG: hypothetical protein WCG85_24365, partial [Polyangia bacterium]